MSSWFFVKDGERSGPMGRAELDARIAEGVVGADTLVWRTGLSAWAKAGEVPELGLPSPPPLPPPLPLAAPRRPVAAPERIFGEPGAERLRTRFSTRAGSTPDYAGFWVRLAAKLIDGVVLLGFGLLVERAVTALYFDGIAPDIMTDWAEWVRLVSITFPINLVVVLVYSVYFTLRHEATPGKRMLGLRLVRSDGGRLGAGRVIGRYFAEQVSGIVFLAGYVMAAFDEEKRTLHDYMCDTRVVRGRREEE